MPSSQSMGERLLSAFQDLVGGTDAQRRVASASLAALGERHDLTAGQRGMTILGQALAAQLDGRHRDALEMLERLEPDERAVRELAERLRRESRSALRLGADAPGREARAGAAGEPSTASTPGYLHLDRGGAAFASGDRATAASEWRQAIAAFAADGDVRGQAQAQGDLGMLLVSGPDAGHEEGLAALEAAMVVKHALDDARGLALDCMNLAQFRLARRSLEFAIAHSWQAVLFAQASGDRQILAKALHDRAMTDLVMGQLKPARADARDCVRIAEELRDEALAEDGRDLLRRADLYGREGLGLGPRDPCRCGSGKGYVDCCGRAAHDPIEVGLLVPGHALGEHASPAPRTRGERPVLLDLQMRRGDGARYRRGWARVTRQKGWFELGEMPDMASQHLLAARRLTELEPGDGVGQGVVDLDVPIAACILALCAVEAFANSVAFLVHEAMREDEIPLATVPPGLASDPEGFVRGTELRQKWRCLEQVLGSPERTCKKLGERFDLLVAIRNELVHFKATGFETVRPKPPRPHPFLERAAGAFEIRDAPRSWPVRLLTPGFGRWCVAVADELIAGLREQYAARFGEPE